LADFNAYSGLGEERIRSGNATGSGGKVQFKSPAGRNLSSENPLDKNVSHLALKNSLFLWWL
jgi:hypothetical protein